MTMVPLQWGRQCQLVDSNNAIATRATTPSWIKGNDTIVLRARMPALQWQRCLRIDGNDAFTTRVDAIATRAIMPAWGRQWRHCNKGNNTIADQGQQHHCYEGNDASLTMAWTPVHWLWQQRHCHERNNCNCNNSKDACTSMAIMHSQQGQQCQLTRQATRVMTLAWQWRRRLRIDDGVNAIVTRATITIAAMGKMPAHQWQQRHHNKGNNASLMTSNKGNNACVCTHANKHIICLCLHAPLQTIICLSLQASLRTQRTFAVGKRRTNKPLAPPPPLVLHRLFAEIEVICLCGDKKAPTTVILVLQ